MWRALSWTLAAAAFAFIVWRLSLPAHAKTPVPTPAPLSFEARLCERGPESGPPTLRRARGGGLEMRVRQSDGCLVWVPITFGGPR